MPEMPALGGYWSETAGAVAASSTGTAVTAHASADTKGTLVELIASTAHNAQWMSVNIYAGTTSGLTGLLDILIGSATEQVLIANLPTTSREASEGGGGPYLFPVSIPRGSRISAQYQNSTGSSIALVTVQLFSGHPASPWSNCTYVDRYGATATSRGTNIDPGAVANTYSAYSAIANTTLRDIRWLVLCVQNADTASAAATQWTIQVAIGAATEQVIAGDFLLTGGQLTDNAMPFMHYYLPIYIPRGSIISVRAKCSSATDGDRDLYVSLFGAG